MRPVLKKSLRNIKLEKQLIVVKPEHVDKIHINTIQRSLQNTHQFLYDLNSLIRLELVKILLTPKEQQKQRDNRPPQIREFQRKHYESDCTGVQR